VCESVYISIEKIQKGKGHGVLLHADEVTITLTMHASIIVSVLPSQAHRFPLLTLFFVRETQFICNL
jgi:hypothetical protein